MRWSKLDFCGSAFFCFYLYFFSSRIFKLSGFRNKIVRWLSIKLPVLVAPLGLPPLFVPTAIFAQVQILFLYNNSRTGHLITKSNPSCDGVSHCRWLIWTEGNLYGQTRNQPFVSFKLLASSTRVIPSPQTARNQVEMHSKL
jgi:hypothetical protein